MSLLEMLKKKTDSGALILSVEEDSKVNPAGSTLSGMSRNGQAMQLGGTEDRYQVHYPALGGRPDREGSVSVTPRKTFEAAMAWHSAHPEDRVAVLNFASATRPGGGVKTGSSAREESLCRCSTLYPTLDRWWLWQKYYDPNRAVRDNRNTDACIYSPGIVICKTDESFPRRMRQEDWVTVDVISCAAPNLRPQPGNVHSPASGTRVLLSYSEQYDLHVKRAKHILHIAVANKADMLVLGAFGCEALMNDPNAVAEAYRTALAEYGGWFGHIEFAVYCRPTETANYDAFMKTLGTK